MIYECLWRFQSAENNLAPTHLNGDGDKGADVPPKVRAGDAAGALRVAWDGAKVALLHLAAQVVKVGQEQH